MAAWDLYSGTSKQGTRDGLLPLCILWAAWLGNGGSGVAGPFSSDRGAMCGGIVWGYGQDKEDG